MTEEKCPVNSYVYANIGTDSIERLQEARDRLREEFTETVSRYASFSKRLKLMDEGLLLLAQFWLDSLAPQEYSDTMEDFEAMNPNMTDKDNSKFREALLSYYLIRVSKK